MYRLLVESGLCGWRKDQVTRIVDPVDAGRLLVRLRSLAEATTGVLLLYFVGHGVPSKYNGELCLAIADTDPANPDATGLEYPKIKRMLHDDTPATTKIAILDCCYSGRAIGLGPSQLADLSETSGAYTLTAADERAHTPPDNEGNPRTAFTGELLDLLTLGVPDGPPGLNLAAIYPHLRQRLAAKGLPRPNQRSDDAVAAFIFARNIAPPTQAYPDGQPHREHLSTSRAGQVQRVAAHLGGVIHVSGVVVAAGCFIAVNFLPIWSEYWTDNSSGAQMAQATFAFHLAHPLTRQIPTGTGAAAMAPVWTWWLAPVLGLGTAVMLALAVLFPPLLRSADPDLKAIGKRVYGASRLWVGFVVLAVLLAFSTKVPAFNDSVENPAFDVRAVLHSGAWILLAASVVLENTLRGTGKRLGQPMTRFSPEHWRFKLTNQCPKCHKFTFRPTFSKPDGTRISMWSVRRKNQPRVTCSRCGQSWDIYVIS